MKTNIRRLLILLATLFLLSPALLAQEHVFVRARVFSLDPASADALLAASDPHGNPAAVLQKLQDMAARKQATVLANPSVQLVLGTRQSSTGLMRLIAEVQKKGADFEVVARLEYGEQALQTVNHMKRGDSIFMGSFDLKAGAAPSSILVFLAVQ